MKTAILKFSGKTLNEFLSSDVWVKTIKDLNEEYDGIAIVHGAGKNISEWSSLLGHETKFLNGQRVTTSEQMDVVAAVQGGLVNSKIVARLNSVGLDAVGLSGIDRNTFIANYLDKNLGYVGKPELNGSPSWITRFMEEGIIPVFSSVCRDVNGNLMNVNADVFTESLALAIKADTVFFVSDIDGVMINGSVKNSLTEDDIKMGITSGDITEGMIPKLESCTGLLKEGIDKIWIGSKIKNFNNETKGNHGSGTWIITQTGKSYEILSIA